MADPTPTPPADPSVADTAKKLADQAIDAADAVVDLAVDIPKDTARLLASKLRGLLSAVESHLD